jgi:hypothetical protein
VIAFVPLHAPDAAHEVALFADHVSVEELPLRIVLGLALKLTVSDGFALTVTVAI